MTKKKLMPVIVLAAIALVVAVLLGVVNHFTSDTIKKRNESAITESLTKVMKNGEFNKEPDVLRDDAPKTISKVFTEKNGMGTVFVLVTNSGYTGKDIGLTVGIDTEGKITGMKITENNESIVPSELKPGGNYGDNYVGAGSDDIADLVTGATVVYTESAIKNAIKDAFSYLNADREEAPAESLPRDEDEIAALAKALYGNDSAELETLFPEQTQFVKRIYKESGKDSYVAYAYNISQYGTPEFEVLFLVGDDGKVKAVDKILWKVSDPMPEYGFNPPSDDVVDAFFDRFVGSNLSSAESVELVTGVTTTSKNVMNAAKEALKYAVPRSRTEISELAKALYGNNSADLKCTENDLNNVVRFVFREDGKREYVAYVFNYSQYGTPEFEILVHVGEDGKIKNVGKMLWKVSDAKPEWGYVPPTDDVVNAFFNSFIGKSAADIGSVDVATGVTQTSNRVKDAIKAAVDFSRSLSPKSEEEIEELAKELYGAPGNSKLTATKVDGEFVSLIFRETGKRACIVYAFNISEQYGTPEFEILVSIDETGKVKEVKKLIWKVSDAKPEWGYNPPSDDVVDAFFDSFIGKNVASVDSVDVATGVTNTSDRVISAIKEAIQLSKLEVPREESEIDTLAKELYGKNSAILERSELDEGAYARYIYREEGSRAFVVYAFAISQYGTPEFELLIHVGADGTVKGINKLLWKVSDAKPEWGYNPPADNVVDAFFNRFIGKSNANISTVDVATGVTNTSGRVITAFEEATALSDAIPEVNYKIGIAEIIFISIISVAAVAAIAITIKKRRTDK